MEYIQNPDENAFPQLLVDRPLMPLKLDAAQRALIEMLHKFDKAVLTRDGDSEVDSDEANSDSDDSSLMGAGPRREKEWAGVRRIDLSRFILALPHFLLLNIDFHLPLPQKKCYCPCSKAAIHWRERFGLQEANLCHSNKPFEPNALIAHLVSPGGHTGTVLPMAAYAYLLQMYTGYYKGVKKSYDHEGLHYMGTKTRNEIISYKETQMKRYVRLPLHCHVEHVTRTLTPFSQNLERESRRSRQARSSSDAGRIRDCYSSRKNRSTRKGMFTTSSVILHVTS